MMKNIFSKNNKDAVRVKSNTDIIASADDYLIFLHAKEFISFNKECAEANVKDFNELWLNVKSTFESPQKINFKIRATFENKVSDVSDKHLNANKPLNDNEKNITAIKSDEPVSRKNVYAR